MAHVQLYGGLRPLWDASTPAPSPWAQTAPPPRLCGRVREVQGLPDNRLRLLLGAVRPAAPAPAAAAPLPGLTAWTWEAPLWTPLPGQTVCLTRRPLPMQGFRNPGLADWGLWWAAQGVRWRLWSKGAAHEPELLGEPSASALWRENLRRDFCTALGLPLPDLPPQTGQAVRRPQPEAPLPAVAFRAAAEQSAAEAQDVPQGRAILLALLFGDRRYLTQATLDNFSAATLTHSLALSGQHLAVAGLVGLLCVLAAARLHPGLYLRRPRAVLALWASLPPALVYLWLGNAPPSLLRAAVMLLALAFWLLRGRLCTTLDALCAALLCITLAAPLSVLDTGLQLSVLCVAAIGMGLPWLRVLLPEASVKPGAARSGKALFLRAARPLAQVFLVSLGIQAALLPLNILLFGNAGQWFALNVLWLPVADLLVLPAAVAGLALAALGWTDAARLVLELAALPCTALADGLDWLARAELLQNPALLRPHWTALPAFAALLTALASKAGRPRLPLAAQRLLVLGAALLCVGPLLRLQARTSPDISLQMLDVGQGEALALRLPGHIRLLLDGGGSFSPRFDPGKALVTPALTTNDAPRLAAVCNSHPDVDHMGGLLHVLNVMDVPLLLDNGREHKGERGARWSAVRQECGARALADGDVLLLGDPALHLRLEILHPPRDAADAAAVYSGNDASVVARLTCGGRGLALFTGDAEKPVLRRLLRSGRDLRAQVLVAPHHGSDGSFLSAFYKAVQPQLVLAACGFENRYGYPGRRLRAWLQERNIPLLDTGRYGAVLVSWPRRGAAFAPPLAATAVPWKR
ncbi:ComEC/Rec2 family competence protein [Desulfovibrio legallii]|uniref:ComEC/Rec2 family competence protein n=1 Tax=Desulfovibrio legallii TaxID=571438 RepID=UPI0021497F69|nr:ComEC/Rec2 family competence protein [Desulfovibrio legallii]